MKSNKLFILCSLSFGFSAFAGNMQIGIGASGTFQHSKRNRQQQAQQGVLIQAPIQVQQPTIPLDQVAAPQEQAPVKAPIVIQAPSMVPLAPARGIAEQAPVKMDIHGSLPAVEAGPVLMPDVIADGSDIVYNHPYDNMDAAAQISNRNQFATRMNILSRQTAKDLANGGGDTGGCIVAVHSFLDSMCGMALTHLGDNNHQSFLRAKLGKTSEDAWKDVFQGTFWDRSGTKVKGIGSTLRNLTPFRKHDERSYSYSRCGKPESLETTRISSEKTAELYCRSHLEGHKEQRLTKLLAAIEKDLQRVIDRSEGVAGNDDARDAQMLKNQLAVIKAKSAVKSVLDAQQAMKDYGNPLDLGKDGKVRRGLGKLKFWGDHSQDLVAPNRTRQQRETIQSNYQGLQSFMQDKEISDILAAEIGL